MTTLKPSELQTLMKAKYIRRTGAPGHYQYVYPEVSGAGNDGGKSTPGGEQGQGKPHPGAPGYKLVKVEGSEPEDKERHMFRGGKKVGNIGWKWSRMGGWGWAPQGTGDIRAEVQTYATAAQAVRALERYLVKKGVQER
jgi:hypothetical protein